MFGIKCRSCGVVACVLERCGYSGYVAGILEWVHGFWISCGCSGVGNGVLGMVAVVLDKVRVFWSGCGCSG